MKSKRKAAAPTTGQSWRAENYMEEIISAQEIYLQDIICDFVFKYPNKDDIELYNHIVEFCDVHDIEKVARILKLIRLNKTAMEDITIESNNNT